MILPWRNVPRCGPLFELLIHGPVGLLPYQESNADNRTRVIPTVRRGSPSLAPLHKPFPLSLCSRCREQYFQRHPPPRQSDRAAYHFVILVLVHWVPGLVVLHVPVVLMVRPVADSPPVVGHQDGGVCDISHQIIQLLVVGEAAVTTAASVLASGE
jgi:hypothetical protein